jgi:hypothetical protein
MIHPTTHEVLLTFVALSFGIPSAYLGRLLSTSLVIAFLILGVLHVALWAYAGIMTHFTTLEVAIGMNWHDWIIGSHWCPCCVA